jgi:hypothetical protein
MWGVVPCGGMKRGRVLLPNCAEVVAFLFRFPNSMCMASKVMALSNRCWKDEFLECLVSSFSATFNDTSKKASMYAIIKLGLVKEIDGSP